MLARKARAALAGAALWALSGCAVHNAAFWEPPAYIKPTPMKGRLSALPPPGQRLAVAVYGFTDQTGQFKHSDNVQTLSRAVTQGATSILVKTLQDTGGRGWFQVIERERLDNVLRERAVIREMRSSYLGERVVNPDALPPLLFAGVLLEGGIIGYDSNTKTGGLGARFLGIGGSTQYREDTVTIYLRAVSVKTGEVLSSVSVRKSIAAVGVNGNAFRFVEFKELLEAEAGFSYNEPDQIALTYAIEKAVYGLIMEGALTGLWCIAAQPQETERMLRDYVADRDSLGSTAKATLPAPRRGQPGTGACAAAQRAAMRPVTPRPAPAAPASMPPAIAAIPVQPRVPIEPAPNYPLMVSRPVVQRIAPAAATPSAISSPPADATGGGATPAQREEGG